MTDEDIFALRYRRMQEDAEAAELLEAEQLAAEREAIDRLAPALDWHSVGIVALFVLAAVLIMLGVGEWRL